MDSTSGPGGLDAELVREFEEFFTATRRSVLLVVLPLVRDYGEAEDAVQHAYEQAARRWARVRLYDDPAAWVRRVAYNKALNWLRRARRTVVQLLPDLAEVDRAHTDAVEEPELVHALRRLPHRDRVVLTLRYVLQYTVEEIADELGTNPNTVKTRISRAKKRLAATVRPDEQVAGPQTRVRLS